jgi:hypothetical protein
METNIPQEEHTPLLLAAATASSNLPTEERMSAEDILGGNKLEAATRELYSSWTNFMAWERAC